MTVCYVDTFARMRLATMRAGAEHAERLLPHILTLAAHQYGLTPRDLIVRCARGTGKQADARRLALHLARHAGLDDIWVALYCNVDVRSLDYWEQDRGRSRDNELKRHIEDLTPLLEKLEKAA